MSEFPINPKLSIILAHCEVIGPRMDLTLKMALDTGATYTIIPVEAAVSIGCDPTKSQKRIEITTGSGVEYVPMVTIAEFRAFGIVVKHFSVICHTLPSQSPVEGLIGLDFMKKSGITIDFTRNIIKTPQ